MKNYGNKILVVDDEKNVLLVLADMIKRLGYEVITTTNPKEALKLIKRDYSIFLVISDMRMPEMDGITLLKESLRERPQLPFVVITAFATVENAVESMKAGALDYIKKPFNSSEISRVIKKAYSIYHGSQRKFQINQSNNRGDSFVLVGKSSHIKEIISLIERISESESNVLITGESGTGKELVARLIHLKSRRSQGPFIKINCGAIPQDLLESELFGYEKGAFTGAVISKPGKIELATGGTLLLDEIGDLPLNMQVKLLNFLQDGTIERIGGIETIKVDTRVIALTNKDIEKMVKDGSFRDDLYYRLHVIHIHMIPLRDRKEDIPPLFDHFLKIICEKQNRPVPEVEPSVYEILKAHSWPGNVRELENFTERVLLFLDSDVITSDYILTLKNRNISDTASVKEYLYKKSSLKEIVNRVTMDITKKIIKEALERNSWNITKTAKELGISRKGLQQKIKALDIKRSV